MFWLPFVARVYWCSLLLYPFFKQLSFIPLTSFIALPFPSPPVLYFSSLLQFFVCHSSNASHPSSLPFSSLRFSFLHCFLMFFLRRSCAFPSLLFYFILPSSLISSSASSSTLFTYFFPITVRLSSLLSSLSSPSVTPGKGD